MLNKKMVFVLKSVSFYKLFVSFSVNFNVKLIENYTNACYNKLRTIEEDGICIEKL